MLPKTDKRVVKLLEQLLQFNPCFRYSASEVKKDIVFDKFRTEIIEQHSTEKIFLEVDQDDSFDY